MLGSVIVVVSVYSWSVCASRMPLASSFHPPQRRTLALERSFDMRARAGKPGHYGADRHALNVGDLAVTQSLQHDQQQHRALLLDKGGQRARNVAAFRFGATGVGIVLEQRHELRPPGERSPAVLVEVGQDGVEPAPDVTA